VVHFRGVVVKHRDKFNFTRLTRNIPAETATEKGMSPGGFIEGHLNLNYHERSLFWFYIGLTNSILGIESVFSF
jgi:hypothetical protein